MQAGAVRHADEQLGTHRLHKVQHAQPLLLGQHVQVALRGLAAGGAVKVVVGLGGPGAGHPHPRRAEFLRQLADALIVQVDGRVHLHQIAHHGLIGGRGFQHERLGARYLTGGVRLPEGAAGDLGKFHVVGHHHGIDLTQLFQAGEVQFHKFCHFVLLSVAKE